MWKSGDKTVFGFFQFRSSWKWKCEDKTAVAFSSSGHQEIKSVKTKNCRIFPAPVIVKRQHTQSLPIRVQWVTNQASVVWSYEKWKCRLVIVVAFFLLQLLLKHITLGDYKRKLDNWSGLWQEESSNSNQPAALWSYEKRNHEFMIVVAVSPLRSSLHQNITLDNHKRK